MTKYDRLATPFVSIKQMPRRRAPFAAVFDGPSWLPLKFKRRRRRAKRKGKA